LGEKPQDQPAGFCGCLDDWGAVHPTGTEDSGKQEMAQQLKVEQAVSSATTTGSYRWVVCALLFFATTINCMDRQILSLLKPILDNQLHWTNEEFGAISGAFQGAYAIGALLFGYLVDRLGSKIGYALSITGWSLAAIGHALVSSVGGFMIARVCLGISEAGNFPSSMAYLTRAPTPDRSSHRSSCLGLR
jgi:MFS family permease